MSAMHAVMSTILRLETRMPESLPVLLLKTCLTTGYARSAAWAKRSSPLKIDRSRKVERVKRAERAKRAKRAKHECADCLFCQWCSDERCRLCRADKRSSKAKAHT